MVDYQMVMCSSQIREAIEHFLSDRNSVCNETLREELNGWIKLNMTTISFQLVKKIYHEMKHSKIVYLHELLEGSELQLPAVQEPPRNPQLESRLNSIRARAEQTEYNQMVKNVDQNVAKDRFFQLGLEVQSTSRQLWTVVNFFITVIGAFTFGYFAAHFAGFEIPGAVFIGLALAIVVFLADLYFLVKTPSIVAYKQSQ